MQKLNIRTNLISKIQRKAKRAAIKRISSDIATIKSEAPAIDVLLQYGKQKALPQILNRHKEVPQRIIGAQVLRYNGSLAQLIISSESKDHIQLSSQEISFQKYKCSPNKYLLNHKENNSESKKSDRKLQRSRILTMPSQLSQLKQQLKQLPSVGLSPKRSKKHYLLHQRRVVTNPQHNQSDLLSKDYSYAPISRQKTYQSISLASSEFHSRTLRKEKQSAKIKHGMKQIDRQRDMPDLSQSFQQRRKSYLQNIRSIIDKSRQQVKPVRAYLTETDIHRMRKAEEKLKRFMDYQEPPSQTIMQLMQQIHQIQNNQETLMKLQARRQAKDSVGLKFKLNLDNENQIHKKRIKRFIQSKKQYKIDLVKLNTAQVNIAKKEKNVNKILQEEYQKESVDTKNQNYNHRIQVTCQRCQ